MVAYVAISIPVIGEGFAARAWGLRTRGIVFATAVGVLALACLAAILRPESCEKSGRSTYADADEFSPMRLAFPTSDEVAAQMSPDRDRAIDVIRIGALLGVVLGHPVMATSVIADDVLHCDNPLTRPVVFQAATWIFQIQPLFFFAGAAASMAAWRADASWGQWLMKRCAKLFRPVFAYLTFWAVALTILHQLLPPHVSNPVAGVWTQLLWFLGTYMLMLAAMPLLIRIRTLAQLVAAATVVYLAVWLIPGMFGVAYGPYDLSLVGIEGQRLASVVPPSLLRAGHAIMMCCLIIAAAPAIGRSARASRVEIALRQSFPSRSPVSRSCGGTPGDSPRPRANGLVWHRGPCARSRPPISPSYAPAPRGTFAWCRPADRTLIRPCW
ncbi:hypothetical protein MSAR_27480 [Mycolicibacterium sarraceniae]|uniref:Acyltransferase 3 domain-containing protein n=1 Tax=Mycolicibacterium sarraceniae TaxID=1534348 RepID=A0A7I7SRJ7_9MYCO|nr:hypothetical protein MSAR_27480 [Mycolicibacterium sarraceniae]